MIFLLWGPLLEILKNLPLALFGSLSPAELTRYERQLRLGAWGLSAQIKLKAARVFVAGAAGLVSAAAFNLVTAGVGYIRIVDVQRVSLQDLGDQLLYRERDLNKPKVAILRQRLQEANPFSEVDCLERKISDHNILKIIQGADLLLADLREPQTAAVLNRAAIKMKVPLLLAWTQEMQGYTITFKPGQGLCLECTSLLEQSSQSNASMSPMSTVMGGMMCLEAMRILGGTGPAWLERLFYYNADLGHCLEEPISGRKECLVCKRK